MNRTPLNFTFENPKRAFHDNRDDRKNHNDDIQSLQADFKHMKEKFELQLFHEKEMAKLKDQIHDLKIELIKKDVKFAEEKQKFVEEKSKLLIEITELRGNLKTDVLMQPN